MTLSQAHDVIARAGGKPGRRWPALAGSGRPQQAAGGTASRTAAQRQSGGPAGTGRPRYLEYLESFPGHPGAATLRQLATALCTTPAALLGAGQGRRPAVTPGGLLGLGRPAGAARPRRVPPAARAAGDRTDRLPPRPGWRSCR